MSFCQTCYLSEDEFKATFGQPMTQAGDDEEPCCEFWSYFDAIPATDFGGRRCGEGRVNWVWRDPSGRYEYVLVNTGDANVFMVLVLNRDAGAVLGHRLLNLNN